MFSETDRHSGLVMINASDRVSLSVHLYNQCLHTMNSKSKQVFKGYHNDHKSPTKMLHIGGIV